MRLRIPAALLLFALAGAGPAGATGPAEPPSAPPLGHRAWDAESGLPQNSVQAIVQGSDGFLWIATQSGLARFDGIRFQVFEPATSPGLPDLDVRSLAQSGDGTLWIGTFSGLASYRDGAFRSAPIAGQEDSHVFALRTAPDGTVWGGSEGAAF